MSDSLSRLVSHGGHGQFIGKADVVIESDGSPLEVTSHATFFSIEDDAATRVVLTPMESTGSLADALAILQQFFNWFPPIQQAEASEWRRAVLANQDWPSDWGTVHSAKFDLPNSIEVYVELKMFGKSDSWYTSVHMHYVPHR